MNKKIISVMTAAAVTAFSVFLVGCEQQTPSGADYSFDYALTGNPESLDPQFASDVNSMTVINNLFTGLMSMDGSGIPQKAIAEDYEVSGDGLRYTFTLRSDCFWFYDENKNEEQDSGELTPVTAYDFEFAFMRMFNPETRSPHRESFECLKNAKSIISGSKEYTELGVRAESDTRLVFELDHVSADFLNSLTLTAAMPCSQKFFESTKGRYGLDDKSIASNGAFFVRQWFYDPYGNDNFIYMDRNSGNDGFDRIYPTHLNFYIKNSRKEAAESFTGGTSDALTVFEYSKSEYEDNDISASFNYTLGIIVNPAKQQYSNKSIRKALAYGIDKASFDGELPEDMLAAYGIIPPGVSFLNRSYREINADRSVSVSYVDGEMISYDPEKALEFFNSGMEQMGLQSLENIKLLVPENFMDTEYLHLVTLNWQTLFGFYVGIEEVEEEEYYQRIADGDYIMAVYPLKGSSNSPVAFLERFEAENNAFGFSSGSLQDVLDQIRNLEDYNDGVELYLEAEKIILNEFLFIPVFYKEEFFIQGIGDHDIRYEPFSGLLDFRYAKFYE